MGFDEVDVRLRRLWWSRAWSGGEKGVGCRVKEVKIECQDKGVTGDARQGGEERNEREPGTKRRNGGTSATSQGIYTPGKERNLSSLPGSPYNGSNVSEGTLPAFFLSLPARARTHGSSLLGQMRMYPLHPAAENDSGNAPPRTRTTLPSRSSLWASASYSSPSTSQPSSWP